MFKIKYHDVRGRIGAYVAGKRKKCVKKVQNYTFSAPFGESASRPKCILKIFSLQYCNPFRRPNFKRLYSPTEAVFQNRDNRKSSK